MCTVVVQTNPFFLLSNRDEFLDRPAAPLDYWPDQGGDASPPLDPPPRILAGRDLRSGGAWLGFGPQRRWGVLTNIPGPAPENAPTRGTLVQNFLTSSLSPEDYAKTIDRHRYAGFNLLIGDREQLVYLSSQDAPRQLSPGLHALGNAPLDQQSPRVRRARQLVQQSQAQTPEEWLDLFRDPLVWIDLPGYGTRCTTLAIGDQVWERTRGHHEVRQRQWKA